MPPKRVQSNQELLEFVVSRYKVYKKTFDEGHDFVSRFYLKQVMNDLLIIQRYASGNDDGKGGAESGTSLS